MAALYESLELTRSGPVVEIVLNRASALNAVDQTMHSDLIAAFVAAQEMPDVRAIVFGARGKTFSAGGDFDLIVSDRQHPERRGRMASDARMLFSAVVECPIPIVVALQGDVVGLGTTLILGCDAIVAARRARISDPHVVIGLAAGDGGCVVWPQAVGLLQAKRYLLTGDRLTAEDAFRLGLVTDLVDAPEDVLPAARRLADRIAALPPMAVQQTKRVLNEGIRAHVETVFSLGIRVELDTMFSEDAGEAIVAIRERRTGIYHNR